MSWRDTIRKEGEEPKKTGSWRDTIRKEGTESTQGDALLGGVQQGVTWGFSDEIVGAMDGILASTGDMLVPEGTTNPYKDKTLDEVYSAGRDEERARLAELRKDNPKTMMAGELAGGILVPGAALSKAKGLKEFVKKGAAVGAVEGGVAGLGMSEATDGKELAEDALVGGAIGATAGGLLGGVVGKVAAKGSKTASNNLGFKEVEADEFFKTVDKFRDSSDMASANIHKYTPEDYAKMKVYLSADGKSGYAIKDGNELVSVHSSEKGRGEDIVTNAVAEGARKLDAYDIKGKLPELYGKLGFKEKARSSFNDEYADMNNTVLSGERPDFVEMEIPDDVSGVLGKLSRTEIQRVMPAFAKEMLGGLGDNAADAVTKLALPDSLILRAEHAAKAGATAANNTFKKIQEKTMKELLDDASNPSARLDMIRYMRYVTSKAAQLGDETMQKGKAPKKLKKSTVKKENEDMKGLIAQFEKARDQGQVTPESFSEFKLGEYIADEVTKQDMARRAVYTKGLGKGDDKLVKKNVKDYDLKDPLKGARRWVLDAMVAGRKIDKETKLDVELIQNELYSQVNKKKGFDMGIASVHKAANKLRDNADKKSALSDDAIIEALEAGDLSNPVVAAYRNTLDHLLVRMKDAGLDIKSRANYVPLRKKTGVDLIKALENQAEKLLGETTDNALLKKTLGKLDDADTDSDAVKFLETLDGSRKDLGYLKYYLQKVHNTRLDTVEEMREAVKGLRNSSTLQRSSDPEVGAAFERNGTMPDWLREKNIDKLIWQNTDQASNAIFVLPTAKKLDSRIYALERMGLDNAAKWLKNYRLDVSGIQRPKPMSGDMLGTTKQKLMLWGEDSDNEILKAAPYFIEAAASSVYPNLIGLSPKAILRNLVQPITMTASEMGFIDSAGALARGYGGVIKGIRDAGGWKKFRQGLIDDGTIPESVGTGDFEGVRSGIADWSKSNGVKTTQAVIDKYTKLAMWGFGKSDEINRAVTKHMSNDFADQILKGNTKPLKKLPTAVSNKIKDTLASDLDNKEEVIKEVMSRWMVVQTQLAYGKVGSNELGRSFGPGLSMFTKWPVAISSDVYDKIDNGEYIRPLIKYFGPLVAVSALTRAMNDGDEEMSPRMKALLGGSGLPAWMPVHSVFGMTDLTTPVNIQTPIEFGASAMDYGVKEMTGKANSRDRRKIGRAAKRAAMQYVPVAGGLWKAYENNIEGILMNQSKRKKK